MRTRLRGSPSRPWRRPETGYVEADCACPTRWKCKVNLTYITPKVREGLVCNYQIYFMEKSFSRAGVPSRLAQKTDIGEFLAKIIGKSKFRPFRLNRSSEIYIVPAHGLSKYLAWPVCLWGECVPVVFDCWPDRYSEWEWFFRSYNIKLAFLSAQAPVMHFKGRIPETEFVWCPECTDPSVYDPGPDLFFRTNDVVELGRMHEEYHQRIRLMTNACSFIHLHPMRRGEHVFSTCRQRLIDGLAQTKVMVCFPASMTDQQKASVETVTHRYFEAFASRCLIIGHAPTELIELFGYNPVIEVDWLEPDSQLKKILQNIDDFQGFVDRNYERFLHVGTCDNRVEFILSELERRGWIASRSTTATTAQA